MSKLAINSFDVDFTDKNDKKGDIFHVSPDPENDEFYCLVREREGICVVVDFNKDQSNFDERIQNGRN